MPNSVRGPGAGPRTTGRPVPQRQPASAAAAGPPVAVRGRSPPGARRAAAAAAPGCHGPAGPAQPLGPGLHDHAAGARRGQAGLAPGGRRRRVRQRRRAGPAAHLSHRRAARRGARPGRQPVRLHRRGLPGRGRPHGGRGPGSDGARRWPRCSTSRAADLEERLSRDSRYVVLAAQVSPEITDAIEELELSGLLFEDDPVRLYPAGDRRRTGHRLRRPRGRRAGRHRAGLPGRARRYAGPAAGRGGQRRQPDPVRASTSRRRPPTAAR